MDYYVIFHSHTELSYLKFLKPGFRHVSLVINDGENWISYDPLKTHTKINVLKILPSYEFNHYVKSFDEISYVKVKFKIDRKRIYFPGPFSCVECVKRTLGIHNPFILTPYQLYKYLRKENIDARST